MPGTVNWKATYQGSGPAAVLELFSASSEDAGPVVTKPCPCNPCIGCPWPMENLAFGGYKAAISSGSDRYFYVEGVDPITSPNTFANGTTVTLSQSHPEALVKIRVVT